MKYRRIIPVDARQLPPLTPGWHEHAPLSLDELAEWCGGQKFNTLAGGAYVLVPRFDGDMRAWPGDWIVQDVLGGFHKVKHTDFAASFQPVHTPVYPHCQHCHDHNGPWLGSETLTEAGDGHTEPCQNCQEEQS